jgi:ribose-phosphate pyrophosphokinase
MTIYLGDKDQEAFYVKAVQEDPEEATYLPVKEWLYPAGEIGIELDFSELVLDRVEEFEIFALIKSNNDLMKTFLATNAIRSKCEEVNIVLHCPYIPYARQDRVCAEGQSFSLQVAAELINLQGYSRVVGLDAHSKVTERLIHNYLADDEAAVMLNTLRGVLNSEYIENSYLVCPDNGAILRTLTASAALGCPIAGVGRKNRNPKTGEITSTDVDLLYNLSGKNIIIVDDICDGGRTFVELARALRKYPPKSPLSITLYVSHGIFSKGLEVFDNLIDNVCCGYYLGKENANTQE